MASVVKRKTQPPPRLPLESARGYESLIPVTSPPSLVESRTRSWLDTTMDPGIGTSAPLFDAEGRPTGISRYHFGRLHRKLRILRWLDRLQFDSFLDLASGCEHVPWLVRQRYGVEGHYSDLVHRMNLPLDGPQFGKLDHAVTLRLPRLPFPDRAFDVVVCSEVLEHLVRPVESIAELLRITNKALVLTSLEALSVNRWERFWQHHRVDTRKPHVDRNFLLLEELRAMFGPSAVIECLMNDPDQPASAFLPVAEQDALYSRLNDTGSLIAALRRAGNETRVVPGAMGILAVVARDGVPLASAAAHDDALPAWLLDRTLEEERIGHEILGIVAAWRQGLKPVPQEAVDALVQRTVADALRARLRCPDCRGPLEPDGLGLRCPACAQSFEGQYGVPILYAQREPDGEAALRDALDRLAGGDGTRRALIERVARRQRANEAPPSAIRRAAWWAESRLGMMGDDH